MNNKLIKTNSLWYKIKTFFKNIFLKKKTIIEKQVQVSNNGRFEQNLKAKFNKENEKKDLAEKLLYGEVGINELNETEVDEMTEYFTRDIEDIDSELLRIKKHILAMQQELKK